MATATIRATRASQPGRKSAGALADGRHGVGPEAGPLAFDGSCRGRPSPCRRSPRRALRPHSWKCRPWPDQVIDRRRRNALDLGFLDHRRRDLLRHAQRLKGAWEVAAGAKLWNRQPANPCPTADRHRRRNPPRGLTAPIIGPKRKATQGDTATGPQLESVYASPFGSFAQGASSPRHKTRLRPDSSG